MEYAALGLIFILLLNGRRTTTAAAGKAPVGPNTANNATNTILKSLQQLLARGSQPQSSPKGGSAPGSSAGSASPKVPGGSSGAGGFDVTQRLGDLSSNNATDAIVLDAIQHGSTLAEAGALVGWTPAETIDMLTGTTDVSGDVQSIVNDIASTPAETTPFDLVPVPDLPPQDLTLGDAGGVQTFNDFGAGDPTGINDSADPVFFY